MSDPILELFVVRHADAEDGSAQGDAGRVLTEKGVAQARRLRRALDALGVDLDAVLSSPYTRAVQTAAPLAAGLGARATPVLLDALAEGDPRAIVDALRASVEPQWTRVAVVGHAPSLGEAMSVLIAGEPDAARVRVRKATLAHLTGEVRPRGMQLEAFLPMRAIRALGTNEH